jgi:hypothetical protein|nr:hypothetical protein [Neorhizobium tomejilense]
MDSTKNSNGLIRLIGLAVLGVALICNPISLGVITGVVQTMNFQSEGRDAVREEVFMTSCLRYKDATTWERWTTYSHWKMGWCANYIDRM